jgi:hypothetical protein
MMTSKAKEDCEICCESVTVSKRVSCPFCELLVCKECFKRYISENPHKQLQCMKCNVRFTRETLVNLMGITYASKEYNEVFSEGLFEREMAFRVQTQEICRLILENRKTTAHYNEYEMEELLLKQKLVDMISGLRDKIQFQEELIKMKCSHYVRIHKSMTEFLGKVNTPYNLKINFMYSHWKTTLCARMAVKPTTDFLNEITKDREKLVEYNKEYEKIRKTDKYIEIESKIKFIQEKKKELYDNYHNNVFNKAEANERKEKRVFTMPCVSENCSGFIDENYKCGICSLITCKNCFEIKETDDTHVCKPENVETAKLILKDTKNCPKCGIRIFKISGCSQMWCTKCHCTFDWKTMKIEEGHIHNPHYFQYMRQTNGVIPRNPGDIPLDVTNINCIDFPQRNLGVGLMRKYGKDIVKLAEFRYFIGGISFYAEIRNRDRYGDRRVRFENDKDTKNREYRIQYMLENVSKEIFKKNVLLNELQYQLQIDHVDLDITIVTILKDVLFKYYKEMDEYYNESTNQGQFNIEDFSNICKKNNKEIDKLIQYGNERKLKMEKIHNKNRHIDFYDVERLAQF